MQKKKMKDTATVSAPSRMTRREVVCVSREGVERVNLSRSSRLTDPTPTCL